MTKSSDRSTAKRALATGLVSAASLFALPAAASATEFVSPTGTDAADCSTVATACEHIQVAVNNAAVGETVQVAAGTYDDEPGNQVLINKGLVLTGAGIGQTILDGNTAHSLTAAGTLNVSTATTDAVTVSGLTVREAGAQAAAHGTDNHYAIFIKGSVPAGNATYTLNNVRVEGSGAAGGRDNNLYAVGSNANLVITNSQFAGADFNPVLFERSQGTIDFNGNTVTKGPGSASTAVIDTNYPGGTPGNPSGTAGLHQFRNNTIDGNALASGIGIEAAWSFGGTASGGYAGVEVTGNTITNLGAASIGVYMDNDGVDPGGAALIGDANVNGNSITGPGGIGVRLRGLIAGIDVLSNQITGLTRGIQFDQAQGAPTHVPASAEIHFNRIVDNGTAQLENLAGSPVDAENNWWGCNEGPNANAADCGTVTGTADFDPWVVMGLSAAPASVQTGGQSSQITADLTRNSSGATVSSIFPEVVDVAFATTLGTITSPESTQASRAISTLTSGAAAGTADVSASLDNETVNTPVTITAAPTGGGGVAGEVGTVEGACGNRMDGTSNADSLNGTEGGDRIFGLAGNDTIAGRGFVDCLTGNRGDDRIFPGRAVDLVRAGPGDDFTNARDGKRDKLNCGPGDDAVKVDQFDVVRFCERVTIRLRFAD